MVVAVGTPRPRTRRQLATCFEPRHTQRRLAQPGARFGNGSKTPFIDTVDIWSFFPWVIRIDRKNLLSVDQFNTVCYLNEEGNLKYLTADEVVWNISHMTLTQIPCACWFHWALDVEPRFPWSLAVWMGLGGGWRYLCAWISLCVHIPSWSFIQLSSGGWFPASIRGWGRSRPERGARTKRSPTLPLSWPRPHGGELRSITISNQATPHHHPAAGTSHLLTPIWHPLADPQ